VNTLSHPTPKSGFAARRRASSVVRTVVVACSTLAILLVCYSIYQYSQRDAVLSRERGRSTPMPPLPQADPVATESGIKVGSTNISGGRKIRLTLYSADDDRARMQIEVAESTPNPERSDEFLLKEPEVRLRTSRGNAVRVTADEGRLQGRRKAGNTLDPTRGWLKGHVTIEIDRRTEADLAALPEDVRSRPDPSAIIQVTMNEIEFDAEYAKVIIPGAFHLSAADVDMRASDLEVRFNEAANRVETLRIGAGERLELRQLPPGTLGGGLPGMGTMSERRMTLVEALRATLEARLAAQINARAAAAAAAKPEPVPAPPTAADGSAVPAFIPERDSPKVARGPVKYYARFDKDIDAAREVGGDVQSRIQADMLEILRDFVADDSTLGAKTEKPPTRPPGAAADAVLPAPPPEKIILTWSGPLVVEAVDPGDPRVAGDHRSLVTASGSPVRFSHTEPSTDATCSRLTFSPDDSMLLLVADGDHAVVVRSPEHGVITGTKLSSQTDADAVRVLVTGPGTLVSEDSAARLQGGDAAAAPPAPADGSEAQRVTTIEFGDTVELVGRTVRHTRLDFTGMITSRQRRSLEKAIFTGGVVMTQGETKLAGDHMTVLMRPARNGNDDRPQIEGLEARGNVLMAQAGDRITCQEMDVVMTAGPDGRLIPVAATARGNVDAIQGERTIRANDLLFVEFVEYARDPEPFDAARAYQKAAAAGRDPSTIDWEAARLAHQSSGRREVGLKRLHASGATTITDPSQGFEVSAEDVKCTLIDGQQLDEALVIGPAGGPATVKLRTFSISGHQIRMNVRDEWAEVPGPGRLSFRSKRDLSGEKATDAVPITIEWQERMHYQGRENRARFTGGVHAVSRSETTMNGDSLFVEFIDAEPSASAPAADGREWWIFEDLAGKIAGEEKPGAIDAGAAFNKEPAFLDLQGNARVATQSTDPQTGALLTRIVLAGPKLAVNLRSGTSRMQMEAPGSLLMEDYRPRTTPPATPPATPDASADLFGFDEAQTPSQTLIEWKESMVYDFATDQTRFDGDVALSYFSGSFAQPASGAAAPAPATGGRKTFLTCQSLHADFLDEASRGRDSRVGRITATRLAQFKASRNVDLRIQNAEEDFALKCDDLQYEKDRHILSVQGTPKQSAEIVYRRANGEITTSTWLRFFYNTQTRRIEGGEKPTFGN
jgi:hypothetical protein